MEGSSGLRPHSRGRHLVLCSRSFGPQLLGEEKGGRGGRARRQPQGWGKSASPHRGSNAPSPTPWLLSEEPGYSRQSSAGVVQTHRESTASASRPEGHSGSSPGGEGKSSSLCHCPHCTLEHPREGRMHGCPCSAHPAGETGPE